MLISPASTAPGPAQSRIREQDVLAFVQAAKAGTARSRTGRLRRAGAGCRAKASRPASPAPGRGARRDPQERVTPLRQRIASRLVEAQHTAAMLTTFNECDMSAVMDLRKQYKEEFEKKQGVGLGFMGFFVKAATAALKAFPLVNGSFITDEKGEPTIEKHDYCDIAMAVSTPKGLVVPVVRNCETLSFSQIELAIKDLATQAKRRQTRPRRDEGRHLHDHQRRDLRQSDEDADSEPAADRDPGDARDQEPRRWSTPTGSGRGCDPTDDVPGAVSTTTG